MADWRPLETGARDTATVGRRGKEDTAAAAAAAAATAAATAAEWSNKRNAWWERARAQAGEGALQLP